jgi:pSer/pThr/pTyr-binding forkhead associated (FHA) protein
VGFLISYDKDDNGEIIEVRVGRWLVSSKKSKEENQIFIDDETISPMHAVLKVSNFGDIQVMDQLSDSGSGILRINSVGELDASAAPVRLQHGDLIRFGKRYFVFCGVPKMQIEN